MHGPDILARFLAVPGEPDRSGNCWQYNSRSDRHSKVGCWGVAFDLLLTSELLQKHAASGKAVLGVNHPMRDFSTSRKKKLDLVISRPGGAIPSDAETFRSMVDKYGILLSPEEESKLRSVPDIAIADVGAVLVALEAKAVMTAHIKALPRLYDELNSSHLCVHGASNQALAIGYIQINLASKFVSSVTNNKAARGAGMEVTENDQPKATTRTIAKVSELPRRSSTAGHGFDGIGITVLDFENRGGAVDIVSRSPAPQSGDPFHYAGMITRMGNEYDARFHSI